MTTCFICGDTTDGTDTCSNCESDILEQENRVESELDYDEQDELEYLDKTLFGGY
jgi:hypothetical protein